MNANKLHARDDKKLKRCGWTPMAYITPSFPKPRTIAEKKVMQIISSQYKSTYMMHIYRVAEAMEMAFYAGRVFERYNSKKRR